MATARDAYEPSRTTTPTRARERARYDRELVHGVLDEALVCHLGFVAEGRPVVLPTIHARRGEKLYVHGSTASRPFRLAAEHGMLPACVTVTLVDGLVLARSAMHHSVNYRSVVVHGDARPVEDPDERTAALDVIVDRAWPGRSRACRPPSRRELAATAVLSLDLRHVSAKIRSGPPKDDQEDIDGPWWAGVVPLRFEYGTSIPAPDLRPGIPTPPGLG